jgi:GTP-binding protein
LLADVGLVGFPNAGKSTFISTVSAARPKIADYPFTTLEPHLGVVDLGDFRTFVIADIPGLIEGAHTGAGLGDQFLRHIERTKLLLHLVDVSSVSGRDAVSDYETVNHELASYNQELATRPQFVVATKIDALDEPERLDSLERRAAEDNKPFFAISSATNEGVRELINAVSAKLEELSAENNRSDTVELAL